MQISVGLRQKPHHLGLVGELSNPRPPAGNASGSVIWARVRVNYAPLLSIKPLTRNLGFTLTQLLAVVPFSPAKRLTLPLWIQDAQAQRIRLVSQSWFCESRFTPFSVTQALILVNRPNNLNAMREVYSQLPNVTVAPLHFASDDISGERLLSMMKVDTDQRE
jgi:hypothetical protein